MAEEIITKKIEDLGENMEPADADVFLFGASGGNIIKKIKWGNLMKKLRTLLFVNNRTTTEEGFGLDARQGKLIQDELDQLNTNTSVEYTDFDPQNKFVSPNDSDTWVRTIKHGKEVTMNAGLKVDTTFGKDSKYRICTLPGCKAFRTSYGFAVSQLTGKVLIVSVEQNQDVLCINSQSHTIAIGDRLFVNIRYECQ